MLQQGHLERSKGSLMGQRGPLQGLTGGFDSRTLHHQKFMHIYILLWSKNDLAQSVGATVVLITRQ